MPNVINGTNKIASRSVSAAQKAAQAAREAARKAAAEAERKRREEEARKKREEAERKRKEEEQRKARAQLLKQQAELKAKQAREKTAASQQYVAAGNKTAKKDTSASAYVAAGNKTAKKDTSASAYVAAGNKTAARNTSVSTSTAAGSSAQKNKDIVKQTQEIFQPKLGEQDKTSNMTGFAIAPVFSLGTKATKIEPDETEQKARDTSASAYVAAGNATRKDEKKIEQDKEKDGNIEPIKSTTKDTETKEKDISASAYVAAGNATWKGNDYESIMKDFEKIEQDDAFWAAVNKGNVINNPIGGTRGGRGYGASKGDKEEFTTDQNTYLNYMRGSGNTEAYDKAKETFSAYNKRGNDTRKEEQEAALANPDTAAQTNGYIAEIGRMGEEVVKYENDWRSAKGTITQNISTLEEYSRSLTGNTPEEAAERERVNNMLSEQRGYLKQVDAALAEIGQNKKKLSDEQGRLESSIGYVTKTKEEYEAEQKWYEDEIGRLGWSKFGKSTQEKTAINKQIEEYKERADIAKTKAQIANNQSLQDQDAARLSELTGGALDPNKVKQGKAQHEQDLNGTTNIGADGRPVIIPGNNALYNPFDGGKDIVTGKDLSAAGQATQEQKDRWYQIYTENGGGVKGWNAALDYYYLIEPELNAKAGKYQYEVVKEMEDGSFRKNFAVVSNAAGAGFERFINDTGQVFDIIRGDTRGRDAGAYETAGGMIRPELDGGMRTVYDVVNSVANMAPSIALGTVNPILGAATIGTSSAGGAINRALKEGKPADEAVAYGIMTGAAEATLQYLIGGFGKLSGITKTAEKVLIKADDAIRKVAKTGKGRLLLNTVARQTLASGGEFSEESLQAFLEPVLRNLAFDENNEIKAFTADQLYDGMIGALTSLILNTGTAVSETQGMIGRKTGMESLLSKSGLSPTQSAPASNTNSMAGLFDMPNINGMMEQRGGMAYGREETQGNGRNAKQGAGRYPVYESSQWSLGTRAEKQADSMARRTGTGEAGRIQAGRRARYENFRGNGIREGRIRQYSFNNIKKDVWPSEFYKIAEINAKQGLRTNFALDSIKFDEMVNGEKIAAEVRGVLTGKHVILRVNDEAATVEQINGHENFHYVVLQNPQLYREVQEKISRIVPEQVMDIVVKQHLSDYEGTYNTADMAVAMREEVLADIAGGMSPLANIPEVQAAIEKFNSAAYGRKMALKQRRGIEKSTRYSMISEQRGGMNNAKANKNTGTLRSGNYRYGPIQGRAANGGGTGTYAKNNSGMGRRQIEIRGQNGAERIGFAGVEPASYAPQHREIETTAYDMGYTPYIVKSGQKITYYTEQKNGTMKKRETVVIPTGGAFLDVENGVAFFDEKAGSDVAYHEGYHQVKVRQPQLSSQLEQVIDRVVDKSSNFYTDFALKVEAKYGKNFTPNLLAEELAAEVYRYYKKHGAQAGQILSSYLLKGSDARTILDTARKVDEEYRAYTDRTRGQHGKVKELDTGLTRRMYTKSDRANLPPEVKRLMEADYESLGTIKKKMRNGIAAGILTGKMPEHLKKILKLSKNETAAKIQLIALKRKGLAALMGKPFEPEMVTAEGVRISMDETADKADAGMVFDKEDTGKTPNESLFDSGDGSGIIGENVEWYSVGNDSNIVVTDKAYETAKSGGAHDGKYTDASKWKNNQVKKAYRSYLKQIALHEKKIANPKLYAEEWNSMSEKRKVGLLSKWRKDAIRNAQEASIMKGILRERGTWDE